VLGKVKPLSWKNQEMLDAACPYLTALRESHPPKELSKLDAQEQEV